VRPVASLVAVVVCATLWLPAAATADATARIAGTVRDAGGDALAGAVVSVVVQGCEAGGDGCEQAPVATSDAAGAWSVAGLAPGSYHVHVADPSGAHADQWWDGRAAATDTVSVASGEERTGIDVALGPASVIEGRVLDHTGSPVAVARASTDRTTFSTAESTADGQGRFRLDGLAGRTYEVAFSAPAAGLGTAGETVELPEDSVRDLDVRLPLLGVEVVRVAGADRVATAVAASREAFASATTVVVASASSFPDALAAAPLAAALDAPLLLTGRSLPGPVAEEIARLQATEAVVVGAVGAVPLAVQEELRLLGLEVERFAGETRFDTAALLGRELGAPGGEVVLASGGAFPDALSVAPLAAAEGLPILLSATSGLVHDTARALEAVGATDVLVIGGTSAIATEVTDQLPRPRRLAGPERYATSVAVAEELLRRSGVLDTVYVATGHDFPDALAAGPVAARTRGPVLLVDGANPARSPATLEFLRTHGAAVGSLWVFGGTAAVADGTVADLVRARGEP
jgi:putative cell wall-binding protein